MNYLAFAMLFLCLIGLRVANVVDGGTSQNNFSGVESRGFLPSRELKPIRHSTQSTQLTTQEMSNRYRTVKQDPLRNDDQRRCCFVSLSLLLLSVLSQ